MEQRRSEILAAVVREFIDVGEPVSSGLLYRGYDFGIKPAMIRAEMNALTEEGYLDQPHHSSGRVPSDRGYEFFAGLAFAEEEERGHSLGTLSSLLLEGAWAELVARFADDLGVLGAVREADKPDVYKGGLDHLIDGLSWDSRDEIRSVIRDFEELDRRLADCDLFSEPDSVRVFIGRKSPVTKSPSLSVVAGTYETGRGSVTVFGIGPKRMDYEKSAHVFRGFKKAVKTKKNGRSNKK